MQVPGESSSHGLTFNYTDGVVTSVIDGDATLTAAEDGSYTLGSAATLSVAENAFADGTLVASELTVTTAWNGGSDVTVSDTGDGTMTDGIHANANSAGNVITYKLDDTHYYAFLIDSDGKLVDLTDDTKYPTGTLTVNGITFDKTHAVALSTNGTDYTAIAGTVSGNQISSIDTTNGGVADITASYKNEVLTITPGTGVFTASAKVLSSLNFTADEETPTSLAEGVEIVGTASSAPSAYTKGKASIGVSFTTPTFETGTSLKAATYAFNIGGITGYETDTTTAITDKGTGAAIWKGNVTVTAGDITTTFSSADLTAWLGGTGYLGTAVTAKTVTAAAADTGAATEGLTIALGTKGLIYTTDALNGVWKSLSTVKYGTHAESDGAFTYTLTTTNTVYTGARLEYSGNTLTYYSTSALGTGIKATDTKVEWSLTDGTGEAASVTVTNAQFVDYDNGTDLYADNGLAAGKTITDQKGDGVKGTLDRYTLNGAATWTANGTEPGTDDNGGNTGTAMAGTKNLLDLLGVVGKGSSSTGSSSGSTGSDGSVSKDGDGNYTYTIDVEDLTGIGGAKLTVTANAEGKLQSIVSLTDTANTTYYLGTAAQSSGVTAEAITAVNSGAATLTATSIDVCFWSGNAAVDNAAVTKIVSFENLSTATTIASSAFTSLQCIVADTVTATSTDVTLDDSDKAVDLSNTTDNDFKFTYNGVEFTATVTQSGTNAGKLIANITATGYTSDHTSSALIEAGTITLTKDDSPTYKFTCAVAGSGIATTGGSQDVTADNLAALITGASMDTTATNIATSLASTLTLGDYTITMEYSASAWAVTGVSKSGVDTPYTDKSGNTATASSFVWTAADNKLEIYDSGDTNVDATYTITADTNSTATDPIDDTFTVTEDTTTDIYSTATVDAADNVVSAASSGDDEFILKLGDSGKVLKVTLAAAHTSAASISVGTLSGGTFTVDNAATATNSSPTADDTTTLTDADGTKWNITLASTLTTALEGTLADDATTGTATAWKDLITGITKTISSTVDTGAAGTGTTITDLTDAAAAATFTDAITDGTKITANTPSSSVDDTTFADRLKSTQFGTVAVTGTLADLTMASGSHLVEITLGSTKFYLYTECAEDNTFDGKTEGATYTLTENDRLYNAAGVLVGAGDSSQGLYLSTDTPPVLKVGTGSAGKEVTLTLGFSTADGYQLKSDGTSLANLAEQVTLEELTTLTDVDGSVFTNAELLGADTWKNLTTNSSAKISSETAGQARIEATYLTTQFTSATYEEALAGGAAGVTYSVTTADGGYTGMIALGYSVTNGGAKTPIVDYSGNVEDALYATYTFSSSGEFTITGLYTDESATTKSEDYTFSGATITSSGTTVDYTFTSTYNATFHLPTMGHFSVTLSAHPQKCL